MVSKKNLTALFMVGALGLTLPAPASAQMEQLVIQLGFQAIRMGMTAIGQMRNPEGISYDYKGRKSKKVDPIWGRGPLNKMTGQAETDASKSLKQPAKEIESAAAETAKNTDDNAVKSVKGSILGRGTEEKTAEKEQSEKVTASSEAEPEQTNHASAPVIMMNVSE